MAARVRITSSLSGPPRETARSPGSELREQTGLGEVYLRGLMSAQLRLSVTVLLVGSVLLGGLPVIFAVLPDTAGVELAGAPLPWLLLGIGVYPAAVVTARFYVRASERIERQFSEVVQPGAAVAEPSADDDSAPVLTSDGTPPDQA